MYDIDIIGEGLAGILQTKPLLLMVGGMAVSSIFAAIPGVGSLLFLSMIVPYAMTLSPYECIALVLGIATVSNTANTFSSVLIAVPGSSGSQATIVDGTGKPNALSGLPIRHRHVVQYSVRSSSYYACLLCAPLCLPLDLRN